MSAPCFGVFQDSGGSAPDGRDDGGGGGQGDEGDGGEWRPDTSGGEGRGEGQGNDTKRRPEAPNPFRYITYWFGFEFIVCTTLLLCSYLSTRSTFRFEQIVMQPCRFLFHVPFMFVAGLSATEFRQTIGVFVCHDLRRVNIARIMIGTVG